MAQFVPLINDGGLPQSLAGGVIALGVDSFGISDNNKQTGEFLRVLVGDSFEAHRGLETMDAVASSSVAMDAVASSSVAMDAVASSSVAMDAVASSSVAMDAVASSSVAMDAVVSSSVARDAFISNNTRFQAIRKTLYDMVKTNWVRKVTQSQDTVANANAGMSFPVGIVLANLGTYNNSGGTRMVHYNGVIARDYVNDSNRPSSLQSTPSAVSFNGATFEESGDGYVYTELWAPK